MFAACKSVFVSTHRLKCLKKLVNKVPLAFYTDVHGPQRINPNDFEETDFFSVVLIDYFS